MAHGSAVAHVGGVRAREFIVVVVVILLAVMQLLVVSLVVSILIILIDANRFNGPSSKRHDDDGIDAPPVNAANVDRRIGCWCVSNVSRAMRFAACACACGVPERERTLSSFKWWVPRYPNAARLIQVARARSTRRTTASRWMHVNILILIME